MAIVDEVKLRVPDEVVEQMGVGRRYQRVVAAGNDERRLADAAQPQQARPSQQRELLVLDSRANAAT